MSKRRSQVTKDTVTVKGAESASLFLAALQRFYTQRKYCDVAIVLNDGTALPCHRVVLAAHSGYFHSYLQQTDGYTLLNVTQFRPEHQDLMSTIVQFMYGLPAQVAISQLENLRKLAALLKIGALLKACESTKFNQQSSSTSETIELSAPALDSFMIISMFRFRSEHLYLDTRVDFDTQPSIYCHRVVLAAFSTKFERELTDLANNNNNDDQTEPAVYPSGISSLHIKGVDSVYIRLLPILIDYMYGKPLELKHTQLPLLVDAASVFDAHSIQSGSLSRLCAQVDRQRRQVALEKRLNLSEPDLDLDSLSSTGRGGLSVDPTDAAVIRNAWNRQAPIAAIASTSTSQPADSSNTLCDSQVEVVSVEVGPPITDDQILPVAVHEIADETSQTESDINDDNDDTGAVGMDDGLRFLCNECGSLHQSQMSLSTHYDQQHRLQPAAVVYSDPMITDAGVTVANEVIGSVGGGSDEQDEQGDDVISPLLSDASYPHRTIPSTTRMNETSVNAQSTQQQQHDHVMPQLSSSTTTSAPHCDLCSAQFATLSSRRAHVLRAHAHESNLCVQCATAFDTRAQLNTHLHVVHRQQMFACNYPSCTRKFRSSEGRTRHVQTHRSALVAAAARSRATKASTTVAAVRARKAPPTPEFMCDLCLFVAKNRPNLYEHQKRYHTPNAKMHVCTECGNEYLYKSLLERHFNKVHLKSRPFKCRECDYAASEKAALQSHVNAIHRKHKAHLCTDCCKTFATVSQLARHRRALHKLISTKANLTCEQCDSSFAERRDLNVHMYKAHGGIRPYACDECAQRFVRKDHVLVHKRKQHQD